MIYKTDEMDKRFLHDRDDDDENRCKSILLFGRAGRYSSVPATDHSAAAGRAVKAGRICGRRKGLALTDPSTERDWPGWKLPSAAIMFVGRGRPGGEA
ncbi:hypothetical protein Q2941_47355 [Bradyrhizobium sp. UFLA05-153]